MKQYQLQGIKQLNGTNLILKKKGNPSNSLSFFSLGLLADAIQFDASVRTSVRLLTQMNCAIADPVCQAWSRDGEAALQSSHTLQGC